MANTILIRNSQTKLSGPSELQTAAMQVGELAVNTNSGLLFMGADPVASEGSAAGVAVDNVADYFATPLFSVANVDTPVGSSLDDAEVISGTSAKPVYKLSNINADATGPTLQLDASLATSEAAGDVLGNVDFTGMDTGDAATVYARVKGTIGSPTAGDESGILNFGVATTGSGAYADVMTITGGAAAASSTVAALGNLTVAGDLTVTGTTVTDNVEVVSTSTGVLFEGAAADGHDGLLSSTAATSGKTYVLPNVSGHVPMLAAAATETISSTPAELNLLDGTVNSTELGYLDGATSGNVAASKCIVTDGNADFEMQDNDKIFFGTGADASIYFDATNMQIGTNTNALPIKIGHGTSEVTFGDNVTVAGDLDVTGTFAPASLAVGGGYGDTGATITAAGALSINGAFQGASTGNFDGTLTANTSLTLDTTTITTAELGVLDGLTVGTVAASKAVTVDANKDVGTIRNLTIDGTLSDGNYTFDTSGNVTGLGTIASGAITSSGAIASTNGALAMSDDLDSEFVGIVLTNQSDAADTTGSVSIRFDLEDSAGTAVDAGKILVSKEASFTSTAGTQDANMEFYVSLNGTLTEKASLSSAGVFVATTFSGSGASLTSLPAGNLSGTVNGGVF